MPPINISTRLAEAPADGAFLQYNASSRRLSGKSLVEEVSFAKSESRGTSYSQLVQLSAVPTQYDPNEDFASYFSTGCVVLAVDSSVHELDVDGNEIQTIITLEDIRDARVGRLGVGGDRYIIIANRNGSTDEVVLVPISGGGSFGTPIEIALPVSNSGISSVCVAGSNNDIWYTAENTSKVGKIEDPTGTPVITEYNTATAEAAPMGLTGSYGISYPGVTTGRYLYFLQADSPDGKTLGRVDTATNTIADYDSNAIDSSGQGSLAEGANSPGTSDYLSNLYAVTDSYIYQIDNLDTSPQYNNWESPINDSLTAIRRGLAFYQGRFYYCVASEIQSWNDTDGDDRVDYSDADGDFESLAFVVNPDTGNRELWATGSGRSETAVLIVSSKELPIISGNRTDGSQLFWQQVPDEEFGVLVGNDDLPATGKRVGKVTLSSGAATVETTAFTATCGVRLTGQGGGTLANAGVLSVDTANSTPGTSFDIVSSNNSDDNEVLWEIIEP